MRAGVLQGHHRTVELAVEHDGFAADRPGKRLAIDLVIPAGHIPLIAHEHCEFSD
jgi:hypothetical protein